MSGSFSHEASAKTANKIGINFFISFIMFRLYKNRAQVPWAFDRNNKKGGKRFRWKFLLPEN